MATPGRPLRCLRHRTAEAAHEDAVLDEVLALGGRAVVVESVRGELAGHGGVERDVEQFGAVAVRAEHLRGDETGAGVVALVAEDAVELERVADRLVDLQDHLVGGQQHVHHPGRAVRRVSSSSACSAICEAASPNPNRPSTSAPPWPQNAWPPNVRVWVLLALVRGGVETRVDEPEALLDAAAVAVPRRGDQELVDLATHQRRTPVDDAVVDAEQSRLLMQQFEPIVQRERVPGDLDR